MADLAIATIAFNKPRLIAEQIRLLWKYLDDDHGLTVFDSSTCGEADAAIRIICDDEEVPLVHPGTHLHADTLNAAAAALLNHTSAPYVGFLDHDVFPTKPTRLIPLIEEAGFYGVGQRHAPTGRLYLWPGFCFFSREWLAGRPLDFEGIRGERSKDDGDTGSGLWPLFDGEDWGKLYRPSHAYEAIREPDDFGLQSWGVERIGDWLHLSNGSHWMDVPDPEGRDRIVFEMLAKL